MAVELVQPLLERGQEVGQQGRERVQELVQLGRECVQELVQLGRECVQEQGEDQQPGQEDVHTQCDGTEW